MARHRWNGTNQGNGLMAAAAALSAAMAQGKTAEQLGLLAALFNVVGDNLALLALSAPSGDNLSTPDCCPAQQPETQIGRCP